MREAAIERKLKKEVEDRGGLFLKWTSPGFTGVPDRIALLPGGKILFVEVKRPGKKYRPRQARVAAQLEALEFTVICADCVEDLTDAL